MHSLHRALLLAVLALSLLQVDAYVTQARSGSNGARLARGLSPLRPKRLFNPSIRDSSSATPSTAAPGSIQTGYIGIYSSAPNAKRDGSTLLGYLGAYGVTQTTDGSAGAAWQYSYTVPASTDTPFNLNHPGTPYHLSAVAIRSGPQVTFGPGNVYYAQAQNTRASTPPGSPTSTYVYDTYAIGYAQTAIWEVDPVSEVVTCNWVNPDGSKPTIYTVKSGSSLYITGDVDALRTQLGNPSDFVVAVSCMLSIHQMCADSLADALQPCNSGVSS
ncbi:hypothetical protein BDW22DRAFT_1459240 [Trametopsis cervina]|nr:hypothetical protein BDW22DRAFT_1459240 [Trametopsis cervina]